MTITADDIRCAADKLTAPGAYFEVGLRALGDAKYRTFINAPATLTDVLRNARSHGSAEFIVYEDQRCTYDDFFARVDALAAALQAQFGVVAGDRVAIAMPNCPEWMITFTAAVLIGAVVVPINSWGTASDLDYALTDCGAHVAILDSARHSLVCDQMRDLPMEFLVVGTDERLARQSTHHFGDVLDRAQGTFQPFPARPEDLCLLLYTSGSTGSPKGALHRHIAVCQALMNMLYLGFLLTELEGARELRGGAVADCPLLSVPLFHATGLLSGLILPAMLGQKVVVLRRWDPLAALQAIQAEKVTTLATVPAIVLDLLNHPAFDDFNTASLTRVAAAGAATPTGLPELVNAKLAWVSRSAGYGMTETMSVGATMSGAIFDLKPLSAGIPSPIADLRFTDSDGNGVDAGRPGEIQIHCVTCSPGYWNRPASDLFTPDGWLRTGDVGRLDDDNFLHVTGRIKEIVIRGGENIYPGDIEAAAYQYDGIQEAVAFGIDDDRMGEEVALVYMARSDCDVSPAEVRIFLEGHLPGYKVPKIIVQSPGPLPRNVSQKLHKREVKTRYLHGEYRLTTS